MLVFIAAGLVVLVLIAFFVMNYGNLMVGNLQGRTAAEAAALTAVKDMGRVVYKSQSFGTLALVDDLPDASNAPGGNSLNGRPIVGINTLIGTLRLDLVIGTNLGNSTLTYLASQDIQNLNNDIVAFAKMLGDTSKWVDKNGNKIDVGADATNAYRQFNLRSGKGNAALDGNVTVTVGSLKTKAGATNVPVPTPFDTNHDPGLFGIKDNATTVVSHNGQNQTVYVAGQIIPVSMPLPAFTGTWHTGSQTFSYGFAPIGYKPSLVTLTDPANFVPYTTAPKPSVSTTDLVVDGSLLPCVVQINADEKIQKVESKDGTYEPQKIHYSCTALPGGERLTLPTGSLCIAFPDGTPSSAYDKYNNVNNPP
jgi:hypothetical protein